MQKEKQKQVYSAPLSELLELTQENAVLQSSPGEGSGEEFTF